MCRCVVARLIVARGVFAVGWAVLGHAIGLGGPGAQVKLATAFGTKRPPAAFRYPLHRCAALRAFDGTGFFAGHHRLQKVR